jgi:hypothetical protein
VIDEDAAHQLGRDSEEVRAAGEARLPLIDELEVRLVDECRRLQGVAGALAPQVARGQAPQLRVDERHQLVERARVAAAPTLQKYGDVFGLLSAHVLMSRRPARQTRVFQTPAEHAGQGRRRVVGSAILTFFLAGVREPARPLRDVQVRRERGRGAHGQATESVPGRPKVTAAALGGGRRPLSKTREGKSTMKRNLFVTIAMLGLLTLAAGAARAQSRATINIDVPFEFDAGDTTLPAGVYSVGFIARNHLLLRSTDGQQKVIVSAPFGLSGRNDGQSARLVFRRYGTRHFLAQVWMHKTDSGRELYRSGAERRLDKELKTNKGAAGSSNVVVAAQ